MHTIINELINSRFWYALVFIVALFFIRTIILAIIAKA